MLGRRIGRLLIASALVAGCASSGAGSAAPSTAVHSAAAASVAPSPSPVPSTNAGSPSPVPSTNAGSPSAGAVAGSLDPTTCTESIEPTVVTVTIEDFAFVPPTVEAEAGEVITFTNTGFESHNATLDNGACKTPTLETGGRAGLLFSTTGSFPFHCSVHTWMKGTIVIAAAAARGTLDPEVVPRTGAAGGPRRSGDLDGEQRGA